MSLNFRNVKGEATGVIQAGKWVGCWGGLWRDGVSESGEFGVMVGVDVVDWPRDGCTIVLEVDASWVGGGTEVVS